MDGHDFEKLGDEISDLVDDAVSSMDYQQLNEAISGLVDKALKAGTDTMKSVLRTAAGGENAYKRYRYTPPKEFSSGQKEAQKQKEEAPSGKLYSTTYGDEAKGILSILGGSVLALANAFMLMASGAWGSASGLIINGIFFAAGVGLIALGCSLRNRAKRFKKYKKALGEHTFIDLEALSKATEKPVKFVRKDVKKMISKGWFTEGHLDVEEKTLMTSSETYDQYIQTQKELQEKKLAEARKRASEPVITPEVQDILDKGNEYLREIHSCNEQISGEEISGKIKEIEDVVAEILNRAKEHPEITGDLKKLMNYYLPMTIKLLNAYAEMDRQPVQGENIQKSKKEIEETLDTLHAAFVKLLDSVFAETALDVSTDITVLNTLLAQEGLKEDELQTAMRR